MDGIYRRKGERCGEYLNRLRDAYIREIGKVFEVYKDEIQKILDTADDSWAGIQALLADEGFDDWTIWLFMSLRDHVDESVH